MSEKPATALLDAQRREDTRKAVQILKALQEAEKALMDARNYVSEAAILMDTDMHTDVSQFDSKDMRDLLGALKIATTPLRQKVNRFHDIASWRKEDEKEKA